MNDEIVTTEGQLRDSTKSQADRIESLLRDRFLRWNISYPKPLSFGMRRVLAKARRLARRKDWAASENCYRRILYDNPRLPRIWVQYGHAVKEQGDFWAALGAYTHANKLDPTNADIYIQLGHVQKRLGLENAAEAALLSAFCLRPGQMDLWHDLYSFGFEANKLIELALDPNKIMVTQEQPAAGLKFEIARSRARKAARRLDWAKAVQLYRQVIKLAPNDARTWLMFGHASKEAGHPKQAVAAYLQALVLDPLNHELRRHFDAVRLSAYPPRKAPPEARARPSPPHSTPQLPAPTLKGSRHMDAFILTPVKDLQPLGGDEFLSTGNDPQFALELADGEFPSGTVIFTIEVGQTQPPLQPALYIWTGDNVREVTLPVIGGPQTSKIGIPLPDNITALRFDPTLEPNARFSIKRVAFRECDLATGSLALDGPQASDFLLTPLQHLEQLGKDEFLSTGNDPQFVLELPDGQFPSGNVILTIEVGETQPPLQPALYIWTGANVQEITLPVIGGPQTSEIVVPFPDNVTALRFDPTLEPNARFSIKRVAFRNYDLATDSLVLGASGADGVILTPVQHLQILEKDEFLSTGYDPQFALALADGTLPAGTTIFEIETGQADPLLRPILFVWDGDDIHVFELPILGSHQTSETVLQLPDRVTCMRFDPTDEPDARFSIKRIAFRSADPDTIVATISPQDRAKQEYGIWVQQYDTLTPDDVRAIRRDVERLPLRPLLSVVMPVYNPDPRYLRRALDTVLGQIYPDWELCIADDASTNPEIRKVLQEYARRDPRIKVVFRKTNGHISAASNSALELVQGEFVALMDHDDELPAHALYMVALELNRYPETDFIYTDEDKVDADGHRHDPHFKTDWNLDLFYSQNIVAHLGVYRTSLIRKINGFRVGFEGSQDYDFTLRFLLTTTPDRIRHIPFVLYHWRIFSGVQTFSSDNPDKSVNTAYRALVDHFRETGENVDVKPIESFPSWWRIKRQISTPSPSVTLIIPTRDRLNLLQICVDGILNETDYSNFDIIIIDNESVETETLEYFDSVISDPRVQVLRVTGPFNFSALNNRAVELARGEYVCFVNNDIKVFKSDWLEEMVSQVIRPGIGAVGAKLLYENDNLQHAAVTLGIYGVAGHSHRNFPSNAIGYFGRPQLQQEASAVTAAMLLMPKRVFHEIGGFDEVNLVVAYNDVDLCLRIREAGYHIVYTPFAELYHLESASRGANLKPEQQEREERERCYMINRWGSLLQHDPFYSDNLSLANEAFRLAFPPRTIKPWLDPAGGLDFQTCEQRRFDRDHPVDKQKLQTLAAKTAIVVVLNTTTALFARLAIELKQAHVAPAQIFVVDTTDIGIQRAGLPHIDQLLRAHPQINIELVRDDGQDFSLPRAVNLGVKATAGTEYLLVIADDVYFSKNWFSYLLRTFLCRSDKTVVAARIALPDTTIEVTASLRDTEFEDIVRVADSYDALPTATSSTQSAFATLPVLQSDNHIASRVFFGRRAFLCSTDEPFFDERLYIEGWEEDLSLRLQAKGASFVSTTASLLPLMEIRPRGIMQMWQHIHDFSWFNRKWAGAHDDGTIEFVCPFHRGDVLIGIQVAAQATRMGLRVRMHVAESLIGWVRDFAPNFAVEPLPVPVPPADLTVLNLLRSYLYVVQRLDASPRIIRSHPMRDLDKTGRNLVAAMAQAIGLPRDTKLVALRPVPQRQQIKAMSSLLAPYGDMTVIIHRSGGWALKTIPDPILRKLVSWLKKRHFTVIQIGGPGDEQIEYFDGWITANLSPAEWTVIFRKAKVVIGVDSWSSHLAAILDVPQITLYGSTQPQHVSSKHSFAEQHAPALIVDPVVDCSPCNSLICLRAPVDFCAGYALDEAVVNDFLVSILSAAEC